MTVIKVHKCKMPVRGEAEPGDFYRCVECNDLWKCESSGWYEATVWEYIKYRGQGYPKAENK